MPSVHFQFLTFNNTIHFLKNSIPTILIFYFRKIVLVFINSILLFCFSNVLIFNFALTIYFLLSKFVQLLNTYGTFFPFLNYLLYILMFFYIHHFILLSIKTESLSISHLYVNNHIFMIFSSFNLSNMFLLL